MVQDQRHLYWLQEVQTTQLGDTGDKSIIPGRLCMGTKIVALNATRNSWRGLVSSACGKD